MQPYYRASVKSYITNKTKENIMTDFDKIYSEHHNSVLNLVNSKINDFSLAQEIANDVMMKVYNNLDSYDESKATLKTWILNITKNSIIDYYRKRKLNLISIDYTINEDSEDADLSLSNLIKSNTLSPLENIEQFEIIKNIQSKMNGFSKVSHNRLANLYFNHNFSYDEISKRMKIPLGTVKGTISRIRETLKSELS